jgi:hypothetical protein
MKRRGGDNGDGRPRQIAITRQITYLNCSVNVSSDEEGNRVLHILDPGGATMHNVPIPAAGARELGKNLLSSVEVAGPDDMPEAQ